ncbi:MAG: AmmeMemoRadiSam system protein B [Spirochaetes bacterium]|nr:AmmeMemoRadiSam system protein B [Spirochaetota bacterium]
MKIRRRTLSSGWYPQSEEEVRVILQEYEQRCSCPTANGLAGIAPHAGWFFSGEFAFQVVASLRPAETCVVIGGHLGAWDVIHLYPHDAFETPLGFLERDSELQERIRNEFPTVKTDDSDNTVEIQLPLLKFRFPSIRVVCLRCPPNEEAIRLGKFLADHYKKVKGSFTVLGSTDLTHYGPNYGFSPKGIGEKALKWVREENDKAFLEAAIRKDPVGLIIHAQNNGSACSAGAAAVAASFARELNLTGILLGYGTSWDKHPSSSFVGYGAVIYQ